MKSMKSNPRVTRFLRDQRASQLVEFAITVPIFLIILAGATEFGRYFYYYSTLTNAVRAGARHASKWEKNSSWTVPETSAMVVYGDFSNTSTACKSGQTPPCPILPGLSTSNVVVQANGPSVNNIDSVTVKIVNYKYTPLLDLGKLIGVPSLSLNIDMNASATMHQLYNGPTAGS